jgi:sterol desaturase/sphingolipid hydroxylase (fatty acid hydroxylase superfamily)
MSAFIDKILKTVGEPFSSWDAFVTAATGPIYVILDLRSKTGWLYLLSSLVVAYGVYRLGVRRGYFSGKSFREAVFPADVYLHPSAVVDYKFVAFDQSVRMLLFVPLMSGISYFVYVLLSDSLGVSSLQVSPALAIWVLPFYALVLADLGYYVAHRLMHRLPFLWPFHEVHHSAEVLTPVTVFRVHPVEELVTSCVQSTLNALSAAIFTSVTTVSVHPLSLFGLNFITFCVFLFGFQLRHSHVWLSYGPILSRIFISPAQHQIHHSEAEKHWNKNFGFMFAFWDLMFGTIYVPKEREEIKFGCGTEPEVYGSMRNLYLVPFVKSYRVIRGLVGIKPPAVPTLSESAGTKAVVRESQDAAI